MAIRTQDEILAEISQQLYDDYLEQQGIHIQCKGCGVENVINPRIADARGFGNCRDCGEVL